MQKLYFLIATFDTSWVQINLYKKISQKLNYVQKF